jgi:hypothetical protein
MKGIYSWQTSKKEGTYTRLIEPFEKKIAESLVGLCTKTE